MQEKLNFAINMHRFRKLNLDNKMYCLDSMLMGYESK